MFKEWVDLFFQSWSAAIDLVKKPLGILVFIGLLLIGSFALTFWQRNEGYDLAKKEDSLVFTDKDRRIDYLREVLKTDKIRIDTLQLRLEKKDCLDQSERVFDLLQRLKEKEEASLRKDRERTVELYKKLEKL